MCVLPTYSLFCSAPGRLTYIPIRQAVTFFETAVTLFQQLPTYDWLSDAGITPSDDQTYSLSELQSAIQSSAGVRPL